MDGLWGRRIHGAMAAPMASATAILLGILCISAKDGCGGSDSGVAVESGDGGADVGSTDAAGRLPRPGDPCVGRADCDDGIFCNGAEECVGNVCISARNAACRDPGGCASARCDEGAGACIIDPSAGSCAAGEVCLAELGCTKVEGCTSVTDPRCDDSRACTDDRCDVASGRCLHVARDSKCPATVGACGRGICLGDHVADPSGCGANPDGSRCGKDQGCDSSLACVSLAATCTRDRDCTDGSLCDGVERCVSGRCMSGARTTCQSSDECHRSVCKERALGDSYCIDTKIPACP